ncbi:3482_t:CDS:1, partial [Cetraspora pellucida]
RGIATEQTPEYIENILAWKAPSYKKFFEQEIEKLVNSTEQKDRTFVFSLKTLELADYYFTQLKQTQVSDS